MQVKKNLRITTGIILGCAVILAVLFFSSSAILKKWPATVSKEKITIGWREEFVAVSGAGKTALPKGWMLEIKPGTRPAVFLVGSDTKEGVSFLHMEADKASASLIAKVDGLDIKKTSILRWCWRANILPEGADGRVRAKDDQAIGIYVGSGSTLNNKSISYRWDTNTPKGAEGNCAYGLGTIRVKWYTLRNKEDAAGGRWLTEERNVAEDFEKAWGFYPDEIYVSISCNSQYTASRGIADLDWIEFVSIPTQ